MGQVTEGVFSTGVPYLRTGHGPPLLMASGLTSEHANPTGVWRRMALLGGPFAEHFTVYLANRRPGLVPGTTMAHLAADYAGASGTTSARRPSPRHVDGGSVACSLPSTTRTWWDVSSSRPRPAGSPMRGARPARAAAADRSGRCARGGCLLDGHDGTRPADLSGSRVRLAGGPHVRLRGPVRHGRGPPGRGCLRRRGRSRVTSGRARWCSAVRATRSTRGSLPCTANGIPDGRAVLFPGKSHMYVAGSAVPAAVALGFLIGG